MNDNVHASATEWVVAGRPTPFAGGENERRWKSALAEQSPLPSGPASAKTVDVRFVLAPDRDGAGCDLDNLLDPVLSVVVNRLGWAGGRRPNLVGVSASKEFGEPSGATIRFGAVQPPQLAAGELLLEGIYDGPLPASALDPVFSDWVVQNMTGAMGDGYAALSLSFGGSRINLGDTGTGPIKPLVDGLWPVLGGRPGDPHDWRIRQLIVIKGLPPMGVVGVRLAKLDHPPLSVPPT